MYRYFAKRLIDFTLSLVAFVVLLPLLALLTVITAVKMRGNPFFLQRRPGKNGKVFKLIKFRTMTNQRDAQGNLLPDCKRLTPYGSFLRDTSLDELPELLNIIRGDMAIVGPRPQLVKDLVFFDSNVMRRQSVRPGLTGLAQVNGRNSSGWEERFDYDLKYVENISLLGDIKIILRTVAVVIKKQDVSAQGLATSEDYGDYLLRTGKISLQYYNQMLGRTNQPDYAFMERDYKDYATTIQRFDVRIPE